ncbi:MAG: methionine--tRNA ligase [Parcubacteria group bacterium]|nr:methionine--tRNA ligase [Parcubacteria group bacterium]
MISFDDFKKLELRVGQIKSAEPVSGSEKLLKLLVDFGEHGERQILAGLAKNYSPESLTNTSAIFIFNLEPKNLVGLESQGMILAADTPAGPVIIKPAVDVPSGSIIK